MVLILFLKKLGTFFQRSWKAKSKRNLLKMSNKTYTKGGQRRTIQMSCGHIICGHPTEANKKYERHLRVCEDCKGTGVEKMPSFDKVAGVNNGWKGLSNYGNNRPTEMMTTVSCEGMIFNTTTEARSVAESMRKLDDPEYKARAMEKAMKGFTNLVSDRDAYLEAIYGIRESAEELGIDLRTCKGVRDEVIETYELKKLILIKSLLVKELEDKVKELKAEEDETNDFIKKMREAGYDINVFEM
jgi:hypothetical protein